MLDSLFSGLGVWTLKRWLTKGKYHLEWVVFPSVSMMEIHDDVAEKLCVSYGNVDVTNLTKRKFLLRNVGSKAIDFEEDPLCWQAPGPVLDCYTFEAGSGACLKVTVSSKDKDNRTIDIQWPNYFNFGHQEYVEVLYDNRKKPCSLKLSGSRKNTTISSINVSHEYEERNATRKRILWATIWGLFVAYAFVAIIYLASLSVDTLAYVPLLMFLATLAGVMRSFAKARLEHEGADNTDNLP